MEQLDLRLPPPKHSQTSLKADSAVIKGTTRKDEMWGMIRGIKLLSQIAQLILTPRR